MISSTINTLFLSYDGLTDPLGQSQVLPYLIGLREEGYNIHIISFEKPARLKTLGNKIEVLCKEKGIQWHPLLYHKSPPVLSTLYDLYRMRQKAEELHQQLGFTLVHARSYPPALVALSLKKKYKIPYLFDIRGFWPEERVEGKIWNIQNPVFRYIYDFFKKKEVDLYKEASAVITLTQKAKEILAERSDLKPLPPITVIPCCADMAHFNPDTIYSTLVREIRQKLKLPPDAYVLCYVGSIGTWYMLEEMLQFFTALKEQQATAKFLFITRDSPASIFDAAAKYMISAADIRVTSATYAEVPLYIAAAQASVFFIRPSFSKQASSPTKQGELLAMGKPVVTNAGVGDSDAILSKTGGGVLVEEFSAAAYKKTAVALLSLTVVPSEVRARAADIYSLDAGVEKYKNSYRSILKPHTAPVHE